MNYFKQIYYEMKHQRMMTWVSISGTALSIFLVMVLIMTDSVYSVSVAPETDRDRILEGNGIHVKDNNGISEGSTSGLNHNLLSKIYENLEGIETVSYVDQFDDAENVGTHGRETFSMLPHAVDHNYWKIYDFKFIDGRPFTEDEVKSNMKLVILTRSAARKIFGEEKVAGREVEVNYYPYRVAGVVEDVNPILHSYANFYKVYCTSELKEWDEIFGSSGVILKMKPGVSIESVRSQVKKRYDRIQTELAKMDKSIVYHGQPYTMREVGIGNYGSNNGPDMESHDRTHLIIYAVLLLLPAINLSSMTRGRLRHRVSEIGVRRAFGARKSDIITQIFGENLIVTILGGVLGFIFSIIFLTLASQFFFCFNGDIGNSSLEVVNARPNPGMLFNWGNFLLALALCFILNIFSATVPAWRASRIQPAEAISTAK